VTGFLNKTGHFSLATTIAKAKAMQPAVFFDTQYSNFPVFAEVALRLVSKVAGSGAAERDHKDTKFLWPKARNSLEKQKIYRLKHRFAALRLRNSFYEAGLVDPNKEMVKYWEPADFVDPFVPIATAVPLAAGSVASIVNNAAACYVEDWKLPLLTIDEKTDATARFKLATKLKGLYMRDTDIDYDDYRRCVDVEWTKQKSKDSNYGNKKGWFAVCELVSPYHDQQIADAEIRELYAINQAFYNCVLAAPSTLQTRPLISRGGGAAP
jgi:hypothetical protein